MDRMKHVHILSCKASMYVGVATNKAKHQETIEKEILTRKVQNFIRAPPFKYTAPSDVRELSRVFRSRWIPSVPKFAQQQQQNFFLKYLQASDALLGPMASVAAIIKENTRTSRCKEGHCLDHPPRDVHFSTLQQTWTSRSRASNLLKYGTQVSKVHQN